jgi:hypothetical protein
MIGSHYFVTPSHHPGIRHILAKYPVGGH